MAKLELGRQLCSAPVATEQPLRSRPDGSDSAWFGHSSAVQIIWEGDFMLDELLKQRAQGLKQLEIDGFHISILSLLQLIDDKFLIKH